MRLLRSEVLEFKRELIERARQQISQAGRAFVQRDEGRRRRHES